MVRSGRIKGVKYRKWQLKQLYWLVTDNHDAIMEALHKDLGRPEFETRVGIKGLQDDIIYYVKHFEEWARGEKIKGGFIFSDVCRTHLRAEPRRLVFIIGP